MVVGLSATPFSKGLGRLFTNLVNATTMHDLTEAGVLVPMRVMSCTTANMDGAETSGGEWTDSAAAERGMEIVGDVVSEWVRHGENRKTIVFGATIAHCEELCRQFIGAGVMAAVFTSHTTPTERKALLDEYRKPDSDLRVLISVEALAKALMCRTWAAWWIADRCANRFLPPFRCGAVDCAPHQKPERLIAFCSITAETFCASSRTMKTFTSTAWTHWIPAKSWTRPFAKSRSEKRKTVARPVATSRFLSGACRADSRSSNLLKSTTYPATCGKC